MMAPREDRVARRRRLYRPSPLSAWQWRTMLGFMRWERRRRSRRLAIVLWVGLLGVWFWLAMHVAHVWRDGGTDGELAFTFTLIMMALGAWALYISRRSMAETSLEDRAVAEHGVEFEQLSEPERGLLYQRLLRERVIGRAARDEREMALQQKAAWVAFRILRPALVLFVLGYWGVCFSRPCGSARSELVVSAVVVSWVVMGVLALPQMVRMWTEPDEVGEPRAVTMEREA
ncbi:hypothetical protein EDE15_1640 [Edaphobacter aggregans]|jgi:hypothetical protein|uniref:Uncharacterized protein n=1 Tax=Edaphobacter aggregans TaxID=570835 RepID=A0A3R9P8V2_9BACT|nr:hypothetical protein [Edaphobacter aggregans]RSL16131.1 hypothetical protein EDE15_1640 [Edaphobacter aggregans]